MTAPFDEMVDGRGGLRPQWRGLLGMMTELGHGELAARGQRLDRAFEEEGVTSLLPGASRHAWRCDPVPLPIPAGEFAVLEAGLIQRARLLECVLADFYGPQRLLADGHLPPALLYANPAFLRPCRTPDGLALDAPAPRQLDCYAADLLRGPSGEWRVLADRTGAPAGLAYVRENRRLLGRILPELYRGAPLRDLRPFFDLWQDALQRPIGPRPHRGTALLSPGTDSPHWFEHMMLAAALSCALVEGRDLALRGGEVFVKTLRGLQPIDRLLRRLDGAAIDPLELDPASPYGLAGLLDAARGGAVEITNQPGSAAAEAPALAAFLPALCHHLLGEAPLLSGLTTLWLGDERARALVAQAPARWLIRPAMDGRAHAIAPAALDASGRAALLARIAAEPWAYAASAALPASLAPCVGLGGLEPRPVVLRLFLMFDGNAWRMLPGGLARVIEADDMLAGALPQHGLSKDVWVLHEEDADIIGPQAPNIPPLSIRRASGDLPSRVAEDLFWLGRYGERLEAAARLVRACLARLDRAASLPREAAELQSLARCLSLAGMIGDEANPAAASSIALRAALFASVRGGGAIAELLDRVARLTEASRDRLTGDMYTIVTQAVRQVQADALLARRGTDRPGIDALGHAMDGIVRLAASVAGVAAENMVRGGGWLFLDLGRRIERAQAVSAMLAVALDQPASRIEAALRLVLELCDSVITYRARYLSVLQPAPVLDLVLADAGNPRGLAFQLVAIGGLLREITEGREPALAQAVASLVGRAEAVVQRVLEAPDQAAEAARLPGELAAIEAAIGALSDALTRRYFALLPAPQTLGMGGEETVLLGVA